VEGAITKTLSDDSYEIRKVDTVGPKIGEELRKAAVLAVLIALLLILIYIGWRFEFVFAVGAIIALFHDVMITFGIFSILNFEISLKEIAAFLTIVGYSLNDTIVVYDRIRENLKVMRSESLATIINTSINQSLSRTIITSMTTFFVVFVLFLFGGEVIHGFAFAMCVGIIVGTYSSIFVASALVLDWQTRHGDKEHLRMAHRKK
jgi:preprotein translocase subunit SecF